MKRPHRSLLCTRCNTVTVFDTALMREKRKIGLPCPCDGCGADLLKQKAKSPRRGRSDDQKRSKKQEERVAKRLGAKRQKASGSMGHAKGDIRKDGEIRGECKFTRAKSFSLKLDELIKIENEAAGGEQPAFFIEFQGRQPPKRYVVIPEWLYEYYAGLAGDQ